MIAPKVRPHYNRAPVVEATIDIGIEAGEPVAADQILMLSEDLKSDFPTRLPLHQLQMGFEVGPDGGPPTFSNRQENLGFRLDRPDRVLQLRTNGLSYSHLAPYSDWSTFSAEAKRYWDLYNRAIKPARAVRLAVRMINRVPLPSGDFRLDSCLNLYPTIPASLPSDVQTLGMQLQIPMRHIDESSVVILQLYGAPPVGADSQAIMLDIDFIIQKPVQIDAVFSTLNTLGDAKDDVFEACITDTIRELIS
ncbi:TIGR04255 family protein [Bradyrhizobium sp. 131]|uniref:TIGR04255 family protein n=1 Tax=Bradyrhizobium sp. 131 TaxID=2782609 RepID=UPI001FFEEA92|nr:TIGR04255 family protein [Bradyrhizobium sp. 131]UPK16089.1 TIGR04255 family protein [Bradyrhizobium sp. 131]